jgi:hypothetical protein
MAQTTLPGLLSVLRPVVVPTRNCRSHPPHPALSARTGSGESGLPRRSARGSARTLSSWYVLSGEMVQPEFGEAPLAAHRGPGSQLPAM